MALPPGVAAKTVTIGIGTFFDGTVVNGRATVSAPVNVVHTPSNRPLYSSDMTKPFVDGVVTFDLCPTDADGLNRKDWTYRLRVEVAGATTQPETLWFLLPATGPDTVDLDGLVTVPSSAGIPISVDVLTTEDLPAAIAAGIQDAVDDGTIGGGGGTSTPATTTAAGIVELATNAETTTGTDTARAVTPAGVKAVTDALPATYMTVVNHGSTAGTARPAGAAAVLWIGSVTPTNMTAADLYNGPA